MATNFSTISTPPRQRRPILSPRPPQGMAAPATVGGTMSRLASQTFGTPATMTTPAAAPTLRTAATPEVMAASQVRPTANPAVGLAPQTAAPAPTVAVPAPPAPPTVEERLGGMLTSDSPLMKIAGAEGIRIANRRGLKDSSMAAGAAQREMILAATPIVTAGAQIDASERIAKSEQAAQFERLKYSTASTEGMQAKDIKSREKLAADEIAAAEKQLNRKLTSDEKIAAENRALQKWQTQTEIASREEMQQAEFGQQKYLQTTEGKQRMAELVTQLKASEKIADKNIAAEMERLLANADAEMARLTKQLATANAQQKLEIAAQMERLNVSLEGEMDRLTKAAGFDMQRLKEQGKIDVARDAAQAKNATELAQVQGNIQSKLQAQGNTEQIQRMNLDLANTMKLQDDQQSADLKKLAAAGDQEIRRLVEAGNQERVTLQQSIASQDRERMANAIVNVFQVESQLRAALLSNPNIPADERAAYERAITSLGDPIRAYINQLYGPAPTPTPAPTTGGGMVPPPPTTTPPPPGGMIPPGTLPPGTLPQTAPVGMIPPVVTPPRPATKPRSGGGSRPKSTKPSARK